MRGRQKAVVLKVNDRSGNCPKGLLLCFLLLFFLGVAFLANLLVFEGVRTAFVLASLPRRDGFVTASRIGLTFLAGFAVLACRYTALVFAVLARSLCLDATAFRHRTAGAEQKGRRTGHHRECFNGLHSWSFVER